MLLPVLVDTDQPVEPPDAVVDVDDVIAGPQLVELGDGHLLVALDFAVDTVTLVTVENLVVGIKAQPELAVDEPFVERDAQSPDNGLPAPDLVEDIDEPLDLHLVLGEDVSLETPQGVANHIVGEHLEILVEFGLRSGGETHLDGSGPLGEAVAEHEEPAPGEVGEQPAAAGHERVDTLGLLQIGEGSAPDVVDLAQDEIGVVEPKSGIAADESGQRNARGIGGGIQIGDDGDFGELLGRKLARNLETPDGIDLVAEEIDAVGLALGKGKDVDDTAANGILPGLVDEINARESGVDERLLETADGQPVADTDLDQPLLQRLCVGDPLGQSLGISTEDAVTRTVEIPEGVQRRGTLDNALRILGAISGGSLPSRGKEEDVLLVEQRVEIIEEVSSGIAVLGDEDMHAPDLGDGGGGVERQGPADQLPEVDRGAALPVCPAQLPESLRPGGEPPQLFARRHCWKLKIKN